MRVLIISDTHGRHDNLKRIIKRVDPDEVLHLGDVEGWERELEQIAGVPVTFVRGNCDYNAELPNEAVVTLGKHKAFMTHGHHYNVRFGLGDLADAAKENGCDIAMFGHTHVPELTEEEGVTILNPGSLSLPRQDGRRPTFCVCDIDKNGDPHFAQNELGKPKFFGR